MMETKLRCHICNHTSQPGDEVVFRYQGGVGDVPQCGDSSRCSSRMMYEQDVLDRRGMRRTAREEMNRR